MTMKKEVGKKQNTEVAVAGYEEYEGGGFENQTEADYAVPFLKILQSTSEQLEDNADLKAGMIFNSVSEDVHDGKEGVVFIPATTRHVYIEWKPDLGGYVGELDVNSEVVKNCFNTQDFGEYVTSDGNDLVETFLVYGMQVEADGEAQQAVISFTSTKIKKYKAWMTKAKTIQIKLADGRRIGAPLFAHRYRLSTVTQKNGKHTTYNWNIAFDGENASEARNPSDSQVVQDCAAIKNLLDSGAIRASHETEVGGKENPSEAKTSF